MDAVTKITAMLDALGEAQAQRDLLADDKQRMIAAAMPPEVVKALADIDTEFAGKTEALGKNIAELEATIKNAAPDMDATVKGARKMAVLTPPKAEVKHPADVAAYADTHAPVKRYLKWTVEADAQGLERYATEDPGVLAFITYTPARVAIRDVK